MLTVLQWFIFGMFVWGCCIVMSALARRYAPDSGLDDMDGGGESGHFSRVHRRKSTADRKRDAEREREIEELKRRVETLEAIVTDRRYQWEQEFRKQD